MALPGALGEALRRFLRREAGEIRPITCKCPLRAYRICPQLKTSPIRRCRSCTTLSSTALSTTALFFSLYLMKTVGGTTISRVIVNSTNYMAAPKRCLTWWRHKNTASNLRKSHSFLASSWALTNAGIPLGRRLESLPHSHYSEK